MLSFCNPSPAPEPAAQTSVNKEDSCNGNMRLHVYFHAGACALFREMSSSSHFCICTSRPRSSARTRLRSVLSCVSRHQWSTGIVRATREVASEAREGYVAALPADALTQPEDAINSWEALLHCQGAVHRVYDLACITGCLQMCGASSMCLGGTISHS